MKIVSFLKSVGLLVSYFKLILFKSQSMSRMDLGRSYGVRISSSKYLYCLDEMLKLDFYMQVYFTFILIYGTIYSRFQITSITFYSHRCTKVENVDLLQNFPIAKIHGAFNAYH